MQETTMKKVADGIFLLPASFFFLLGLFFDPEDGDMFLRKVGWLSNEYKALCPKLQNSS
jgi:hypothetical protein